MEGIEPDENTESDADEDREEVRLVEGARRIPQQVRSARDVLLPPDQLKHVAELQPEVGVCRQLQIGSSHARHRDAVDRAEREVAERLAKDGGSRHDDAAGSRSALEAL